MVTNCYFKCLSNQSETKKLLDIYTHDTHNILLPISPCSYVGNTGTQISRT